MQSAIIAPGNALPGTRSVTIAPALMAAVLGLFMVWGIGFSEASAVHNAAHDARHSAGFPCH